jgi:lactoylglutathione lyase
MKYLHTMVRVRDLDASLDFYCNKLGLVEASRFDNTGGRFTLVFLCASDDVDRAKDERTPTVELTYNWDAEDYQGGRNFGHLAYQVDDIYALCQKLLARRATATWRLCAHPTTSRSSFCKRADPCRRPSRGRRCRTSGSGREASSARLQRQLQPKPDEHPAGDAVQRRDHRRSAQGAAEGLSSRDQAAGPG